MAGLAAGWPSATSARSAEAESSRPTNANHIAIYAIILGVDIGPKLTPFGSLATLLWLGILERHSIHISWGHFLRENWWVALLTLAAAFGGLLLASLALG